MVLRSQVPRTFYLWRLGRFSINSVESLKQTLLVSIWLYRWSLLIVSVGEMHILPPDCHNVGNKRGFGETLRSTPEPFKRRKLKLLSETIFLADPDPVDHPTTMTATLPEKTLPTTGGGFKDFTTYPNLIAADKTRYIELLDAQSKYQYLFLRPRRFGKSTFLQTLSTYYDKRLKSSFLDIFGCLYIGRHPTQGANRYLVLCFDFSQLHMSGGFNQATEHYYHSYINSVLSDFLNDNSSFLQPFERDKLLDMDNSALSLRKVLVRHLSWSSRTRAKLDVM